MLLTILVILFIGLPLFKAFLRLFARFGRNFW